MAKTNFIIKISIAFIAVVAITGYAFFETKDLIRGPIISIESPTNNSTTTNQLVEIKGTVKNISRIDMNGRQIFVDENNVFREKMLLALGYNTITVSVEDRFGRTEKKTLEIVFEEGQNKN